MRNTFKILPVLTGDVSGAASALFELGGITAIHDPSGCNSTYNTHDETRWYNSDSMVFISGLNDVDAFFLRRGFYSIKRIAADSPPSFFSLGALNT